MVAAGLGSTPFVSWDRILDGSGAAKARTSSGQARLRSGRTPRLPIDRAAESGLHRCLSLGVSVRSRPSTRRPRMRARRSFSGHWRQSPRTARRRESFGRLYAHVPSILPIDSRRCSVRWASTPTATRRSRWCRSSRGPGGGRRSGRLGSHQAAGLRAAPVGSAKAHVCGQFFKPSDGLEPSTPSLPCAPIGNWLQPVATVLACFGRFRGVPICHRLPLVATAGLHKGSILSCLSRIRAQERQERHIACGSVGQFEWRHPRRRRHSALVQAVGGAALDEVRHDLEDAAARRTTSSPALAGVGVQRGEFEHGVLIGERRVVVTTAGRHSVATAGPR